MQDLCNPIDVVVEANAFYMPHGVIDPTEAQLHQAPVFLAPAHKEELLTWWLVERGKNPTTPNWDICCQGLIEGKPGLILVEAKAHVGECDEKGKRKTKDTNIPNHDHIEKKIFEARDCLNGGELRGWNLERDSHYQLCNRFAWSWKLATLGVPVVLIYLGFLNATDMDDGKTDILKSHGNWVDCIENYSQQHVPWEVWKQEAPLIVMDECGGRRDGFYALIRSMDLGFKVYKGIS